MNPSPNMLMMQPPQQQQHPSAPSHQQIPPQMSPQLSGPNFIGQSPPQTAPINENGSTSDESDDNNLNDANVSTKI